MCVFIYAEVSLFFFNITHPLPASAGRGCVRLEKTNVYFDLMNAMIALGVSDEPLRSMDEAYIFPPIIMAP